jgi:two-component system response regulator NreC
VAQEVHVVVIDTQPLVRSGVRVALGPDSGMSVVGDGASPAEVAGPSAVVVPDVVLLGGGHGLLSVRAVRERWPSAGVLLVTQAGGPASVRQAFDRGVTGVVLPTVDEHELLRALRMVAAGERYVTPELGATLLRDGNVDAKHRSLSSRERDVLRLLALGHTNQEIAHELVVSVRTIEGHRAQVATKLGCSSRAELVKHALAIGLLDEDLARS